MKDAILGLARALLWGSVIGGAPFLLLTVPVVLADIGQAPVGVALLAMFMPILIAGAVTAPAIILLGLPLTALLAHLRRETPGLYITAGFGLGLVIPIGIVLYLGGDWSGAFLSIPGAAAGAAAAGTWGNWREKVADTRPEPAAAL